MDRADIPLLPAHTWETSYRHEDGDLIRLFYVPALMCAAQCDRTTGYFSADSLVLAARGIERLIAVWSSVAVTGPVINTVATTVWGIRAASRT